MIQKDHFVGCHFQKGLLADLLSFQPIFFSLQEINYT